MKHGTMPRPPFWLLVDNGTAFKGVEIACVIVADVLGISPRVLCDGLNHPKGTEESRVHQAVH